MVFASRIKMAISKFLNIRNIDVLEKNRRNKIINTLLLLYLLKLFGYF